MSRIYFISGPCGCGKTTFSDVYARHLVRVNGRTLYLIHGDDFHQGFIEPEDKPEEDPFDNIFKIFNTK